VEAGGLAAHRHGGDADRSPTLRCAVVPGAILRPGPRSIVTLGG